MEKPKKTYRLRCKLCGLEWMAPVDFNFFKQKCTCGGEGINIYLIS